MSMKPYTVVGFHEDNNQPHVTFVEAARGPVHAAMLARERAESPIAIVDVFAGRQAGLLGNDEVILSEDDVSSANGVVREGV
jgi:hypothetical protein